MRLNSEQCKKVSMPAYAVNKNIMIINRHMKIAREADTVYL